MTPVCYVAHPYGGDPANLTRARRWLHWCIRWFPGRAFLAPWLEECAGGPETPEGRELGLEHDRAIVRLCDEVWWVGGRVSEGMMVEARTLWDYWREPCVRDLTGIGAEPPGGTVELPALREPW